MMPSLHVTLQLHTIPGANYYTTYRECDEVYQNHSNFTNQLQSSHTGLPWLSCIVCGYNYQNVEDLIMHVQCTVTT